MPDYGFTLKVDDLTSAQMNKIEDAVRQMGGTVKSVTQGIGQDFNAMAEMAGSLQRKLIEAFSIYEIYNFGKELLNITAEFQGFENVIKYSSVSLVDAGRNLDYIADATDRLHLPIKQAYQGFSEMQAGFYGTGIEGEKLRKIFEGVSTASSVLHLNPEQFSRTTFALKEIGELGTLQSRQLRMLAFALPGAVNIAARALHMSTEKLHEAMKKGQIKSSDFLPKFAEGLQKHFEGGLPNAGNSLISQMNDAQNSIIKNMLDMGQSLIPLWTDILKTITSGMQEIKSIWNSLTQNSNFVELLKTVFDWAVKLIPIWITYRAVMAGVAALTDVFSVENGVLSVSLGELTIMTDGATVATEGLSAAIATLGIGALVIGLGLAVENFISLNKQASDFADKVTNMTKESQLLNSNKDLYTSVSNRYGALNGTQNGEYRSDLLRDAQQAQAKINKDISESVKPDLLAAQKQFDALKSKTANVPTNLNDVDQYHTDIRNKDALAEKISQLSGNLKYQTSAATNLNSYIESLVKKGIKPSLDGGGGGLTDAGKDNATNTSRLAGASGGLGQAKQIFIHIDTIQKNEGVRESKDKSDEAAQKIIEALNGFSDSQNSQ